MDVEFNRDKLLQLFCYGMVQGDKLARSNNPHKIGQHTEAMRITVLKILKQFPDDFEQNVLDAVASQINEGGDKP